MSHQFFQFTNNCPWHSKTIDIFMEPRAWDTVNEKIITRSFWVYEVIANPNDSEDIEINCLKKDGVAYDARV